MPVCEFGTLNELIVRTILYREMLEVNLYLLIIFLNSFIGMIAWFFHNSKFSHNYSKVHTNLSIGTYNPGSAYRNHTYEFFIAR